ncbi:unknown [Bovine gammaherpesvirus 4]|uniref:Uncharacterized protein BORF 34 n=2 Tax=Bovine herpesvirus 4 TaxID=10385 RepID=Q9WI11_BHV4|nr:unknown [Bovine gammaherpesvirus 4]AAD33786.1 unknown [Bovine gammaherpesvirus 4]AAK07953.1 unknown [Bovine gammaherpesvirus 4]AEL29778.1 hypothetical protein [Bovine gammaherpesvirus 4]AIA82779.1 hypothetical protein [Bovine gammaherpesvirus 4]QJC19108.1 hypothetical protein [Bovine gammaherpesvirus 4]
MLNLSYVTSHGDPELNKRYARSVNLALGLCENVSGQFKLIETPLNSFLLVANVLPDDIRPWEYSCYDKFDFSHIKLPKLEKLKELIEYDFEASKPASGNIAGEQPLGPMNHYVVYDSDAWQSALKLNKETIIQAALEKLKNPCHWEGYIPDDPLPLIWLLFYGKNSFCESPDCLYMQRFKHPGPILFPPHIYNPDGDISSFVNHVCHYVNFLYKERTFSLTHTTFLPFEEQRLKRALELLEEVENTATYISKTCLLCHLYKQNEILAAEGQSTHGCIILGGVGKQYITPQLHTTRSTHSGDTLLLPAYNLVGLMECVALDGVSKQEDS